MINHRSLIFLFIFVFIVLAPATSRSSRDVSPSQTLPGSSLTFQDAIRIGIAHNCWPAFISGIWPKTKSNIYRMIKQKSLCEKSAQKIIGSLEKLVGIDEKNIRWNHLIPHKPLINFEYRFFNEDARDFHDGSISGFTSPWTQYEEGLAYRGGHNTVVDFTAGFSIGKWLDLNIQPLFLTTYDKTPSFYIQSGNLKLTFRNFEIKAGRIPIHWGHNYGNGSILFSGNTRPPEGIEIGNPYPTILPWIFKYLGPFQYRVNLIRLDDSHRFAHPLVLSARIDMEPNENIEVGLTRSVQFGGSGAPGYFFLDPVGELFGFRPKDGWIFFIPFKESAHSTAGIANNVFGLDLLWRSRTLRNTEFFFELYNEDPFDPFDFFPEDSIIRIGAWIPRLTNDGTWQLLVEGIYAADIVYTHSVFNAGFTDDQRIMGLDLGPRAWQVYGRLTKIIWPHWKLWSSLDGRLYRPLERSGLNREYRQILKIGGTYLLKDNMHIHFTSGIQYIQNFDHLDGNKIMGLASLKFSYQF
jgi:hypothetical protein